MAITRKLYITGSAYELTVNRITSDGTVRAYIRVVGTQKSSRVRYVVRLFRGTTIIDSHARSGVVAPRATHGVFFTNVRNSGELIVQIHLDKQGGSRGSLTTRIPVPK